LTGPNGANITGEDSIRDSLWLVRVHEEFTKMPFGQVNAPATFQRLMELVLSGLAQDKCHIYLDDVLVFGRTLTEYNRNLLTRIRKARLRLKPKKCKFAKLSVEYLGYVISSAGVQQIRRKSCLSSITQHPPMSNLFVHFLGWHRITGGSLRISPRWLDHSMR
jgi:hypothetical protein